MTDSYETAQLTLPTPAERDRATTGKPDTVAAIDPRRLPAADIFRGLAALWVFLFHLKEGRHIAQLVQALPETLISSLFGAGHLGVPVFFVLSGLVITQSVSHEEGKLFSSKNFLARRMVRLCPPYYFSILVTILFLVLKSRATSEPVTFPDLPVITAHLFYLQDLLAAPAIGTVYWSLCIEVQFYLVFCLLMLAMHKLGSIAAIDTARLVVVGAACAIALLWPVNLVDTPSWRATFLPSWHLFLLGMLVSFALRGGKAWVAAYWVYLILLGMTAIRNGSAFTLTGAVASMLLFASARWPIPALQGKFGFLTTLGLISYSLYLLHNPITGAAFNVTRKIVGHGLLAESIGILFSLSVCLAAAAVSYYVIERPALNWGRHRKKAKPPVS